MVASGEVILDRGEDLLRVYEQTGDERAFSAIVKLYRSMVFGVCLRIMRNSHDAEDATQAVFLTLAMQAKAGSNIRTLGPWLQQVAQRVSLDMYKSRKRRAAREDVRRQQTQDRFEPDEDRQLSQDELRDTLRLQLNELPAKYRLPMILYYFGGLTPEAIAKELGCKKKTLGVRLFRARKLLAEQLASRGVVACGAPLLLALREVMQQGLMHSLPASGSVYAASGATAGLGLGFDHLSGSLVAMARALTRFTIGSKIRLTFVLIAAATAMAGYAGLVREFNWSKLPIIRSVTPKLDSFEDLLRSVPRVFNSHPVSVTLDDRGIAPTDPPQAMRFADAPVSGQPMPLSNIEMFAAATSANPRVSTLPSSLSAQAATSWIHSPVQAAHAIPEPFTRPARKANTFALSLVNTPNTPREQSADHVARTDSGADSEHGTELASASQISATSIADILAAPTAADGTSKEAAIDGALASAAGMESASLDSLPNFASEVLGDGRLAYASAENGLDYAQNTLISPPAVTGAAAGVIPEPAISAIIACFSACLIARRPRHAR